MTTQSYLPKAYCWGGKSIQVATRLRDTVIVPFCAAKACAGVTAYSGWRAAHDATPHSDHLCGYAVDFVPKAGQTMLGKAQMLAAYVYAKARRFPYVEWVWQPGVNCHVHVSFERCGAA